jgi:hypothetical protein
MLVSCAERCLSGRPSDGTWMISAFKHCICIPRAKWNDPEACCAAALAVCHFHVLPVPLKGCVQAASC